MVSSPRFRSPRVRSASAIVPLPEDSSIAYHKEIYTVLFDPPSFLMVYSIVRHLWKLSKSKKFLPLPPLHKSLLAPFDIQGPLLDSASEEEGESSPRVSSVPESVSTNHHCNFGEINCFTVSENSESITSKNEVQLDPESKVKEFVKISINKSWSSSSISDISFATIAILKKDFSESMDLVQDSRRDYFSITMKNHSTSSFANHNLEVLDY
ncbi:hypothetical protein QL285_061423 [Trifolium repens]|nr:hypothetical protein QL285_061423 [Trifolium repens]